MNSDDMNNLGKERNYSSTDSTNEEVLGEYDVVEGECLLVLLYILIQRCQNNIYYKY